LEEYFIIDLVGEITNENVEMVGSILFVGSVGLVSPVDTNFLKVLVYQTKTLGQVLTA
jgi:hypothetical protein